MKGALQKSFFPVLVLIVLVGSVAVANEIIHGMHETNRITGYSAPASGMGQATTGLYIDAMLGMDRSGSNMKGSDNITTTLEGVITLAPLDKSNIPASNDPAPCYRISVTGGAIGYGWNDTSPTEEPNVSVTPSVKPAGSQIPGYQPREDVIVYFNELPASLDAFASSYGVKLIIAKPKIKMAAFETMPALCTGSESQVAHGFIANASKDPRVESAEFDWFMFTDPSKDYTKPWIMTPEDLERNNTSYVPNEVEVGFWRMPPSLKEFGAKYGGTLENSSGACGLNPDYELKFATFTTGNITDFIKKVSSDPYVSSATPVGIGYVGGHISAVPANIDTNVSMA